ncbi:Alpha/Beta hydrolase protein [Boletus coccyginus]|nr:Alpha/Beta hydrolase protein [Boletus coccyginus]
MLPSASSVRQLVLSLVALSPLILAVYILAGFPSPPGPPVAHPSLPALPPSCASWSVYPDDYYQGGFYVLLPHGRTRYWLIGPNHGPRVVLVHGLSIPAIVWKVVAPVLASRGYRVLLYDLYGRGYSDAPDVTYDHIRWDDAYVVGFSMGGGIATAFAVQFPHLVNGKVALAASTGIMESSDISRTAKFMSSPFVQSISSLPPFQVSIITVIPLSDYSRLTALHASPRQCSSQIVRLQSAHLPHYNAAVASSLRDGPTRGLAYAFSALSDSSNDILLIHARQDMADKTVPYKYAAKIQALVPQAKLVTIVDGGHDITATRAKEVNAALLHLLSASLASGTGRRGTQREQTARREWWKRERVNKFEKASVIFTAGC